MRHWRLKGKQTRDLAVTLYWLSSTSGMISLKINFVMIMIRITLRAPNAMTRLYLLDSDLNPGVYIPGIRYGGSCIGIHVLWYNRFQIIWVFVLLWG